MKAEIVQKRDAPKKPPASVKAEPKGKKPMPAEEDNEEQSGKRRFHSETSNLPPVTAIDDQATMDRTKELLEEASLLTTEMDWRKKRLDAIRGELVEVAQAFELGGMKDGRMGFYYGGEKTRWTLSKELLVENGVSPETIKQSYKESKPYEDARFVPFS